MECSALAAPYFIVVIVVLYFVLNNLFLAVFFESFEMDDNDKRKQQIEEYLEESGKQEGAATGLQQRLETVDDFLGSSRRKATAHLNLNTFVSGIRLTEHTAKLVVKSAMNPMNAAKSANCYLALCQRCCPRRRSNHEATDDAADGDKKDSGAREKDYGMVFNNPVLRESVRDGEMFENESPDRKSVSSTNESAPDDADHAAGTHCGLFAKDSDVCRLCTTVADGRWFRYVVIAACLVTAATLGIDTTSQYSVYSNAAVMNDILEDVPLVVFLLEMTIRCISRGALLTPSAHLATVSGIFEFVLMIMLLLSHQRMYPNLRPLRAVVNIRLLYLITRASVIVKTIGTSVSAVWTAGIMIAASFLVFGIVGMNILGGRMNFCSPDISLDRTACIATDGEWLTRPYHFDNIFESSRSLFVVWSMQGWTPILFHASDAANLDDDTLSQETAPAQDENRWQAFIFFSTYIMWNSLMRECAAAFLSQPFAAFPRVTVFPLRSLTKLLR